MEELKVSVAARKSEVAQLKTAIYRLLEDPRLKGFVMKDTEASALNKETRAASPQAKTGGALPEGGSY